MDVESTSSLLVSIGSLGSGGAERVLSILSPYLANHFKKVYVVLWKDHPDFYKLDGRVEIIRLPNKSIIGKLWAFRKLILSIQPTVILSFLYPYSLRVILSLWGMRVNIIVAERRDPRAVKGGNIVRWIRDNMYRKAHRILLQSNFNKSFYPQYLQDKIKVLYNPISIPRSLIKAKREPKNSTIVSVGRLIPEKNHKLLIEAFTIFLKTHPGYQLVIWGEGPLKQQLEEFTISSGLRIGTDIAFPGNSNNVMEEIRNADAFVLTSHSEGMPNALYEALCIGIPCISTKVSGVVDLLDNKVNAILVNESANEIADALTALVNDGSLSNKLAQAGKELYHKLAPESIAKSWIATITE